MSTPDKFKFIKGTYAEGFPADICFYTDVDYWSVDDFLWEFRYLENYVNPSKIRIHVNSVGGSVVDGMSVFAKILDCKVPTETINDSLAASMGSIIWAAGDELYMKDYALLMIHNPFCDANGKKEYNQATEAFTEQLKTIYMKRFGLSEEVVVDIMNGKEGEDGTFMTAAQAVEKGFIQADHVIETPSVIKNQIQAALKGVKDIAKIKAIFASIKDSDGDATTKAKNNNSNTEIMDENKISVFAALLGLTGEKATADCVSASITELKAKAEKAEAAQKELAEAKAELVKVNAELTGAQTSVNNLTEDLNQTKAALQTYKDAEATAKKEKVDALIEKAIKDCKINKEESEAYTKMAEADFDLAENVLSKIPARDNLGKVISQSNQQGASAGLQTEEQKALEKVNEIVGKDFKFRTL